MTHSDLIVPYKSERLKPFMLLRGIDNETLWFKVSDLLGFKVNGANDSIVIEAVATVLEIPVEFFYFRYTITMENWIYILHCPETNKTITIRPTR